MSVPALAYAFEKHLRAKHPIKKRGFRLDYDYQHVPSVFDEDFKADVVGMTYVKKNNFRVLVATDRPAIKYLLTIAHEYQHVLQRQSGIWKGNELMGVDHPLEVEARSFAKREVEKFLEGYRVK